MKSFEKTIGDLTVYATEPSPRFIDIRYRHGNQSIRTMTMKEVRDLKYILEQVLELSERDED